jgi:glycerophosphoryl diester phosphodiesterase
MKKLLLVCLFLTLLVSCSETPVVSVPDSANEIFLQETHRLTPLMRASIEGVYSVLDGSDFFGDEAVLKWSYVVSANLIDTTFGLSVFTSQGVCYFALEGGTLDSVFIFSGYWRKMVNTEAGIVKLAILSSEGGRLLFQPNPVVGRDSIIIRGEFGTGGGFPDRRVTLKYDRPLYNGRRFAVLAHRGGGRTSDLLPVSENSVEMTLFAPRLGATGIEIDVRLTQDGVPILYHDNQLNSRLTRNSGLIGTIEEYNYAQLQAFVRLIHGEKIPTLQQVLDAALYRTSLTEVYLDNKNSANLALERAIQTEYIAKAAAAGRDFKMFIGLPNEEKLNEFLALPDYASALSLCELTIDDTRRAHSLAWAPRWTEGLHLAEVAQMHAEGRAVVTWTVDVPAYVREYVTQGDFDGLLTNYSPIVAYYHYTRR